MLDPAHYEGRGQALVKHTFLDRYLADALPKVSRFGTFEYVDLFAGPWQSRSGDYSDTSFGIALRQMAEAKKVQASLGKNVRMIAHLVELENYSELELAVASHPDVEVQCYSGKAEDHADTIARSLVGGSFRFIVIDPKGLPDLRDFRSLIAPGRTEVLLNFMFQFANRFVATNRMPKLVKWLDSVDPGTDWQAKVDSLSGEEREAFVTDRARRAMANMGGYEYAPAITVDETESERPLYKLIYLTHHPKGLQVFRDAHVSALEVQSGLRVTAMLEREYERRGMEDMFGADEVTLAAERSGKLLKRGRDEAEECAKQLLWEQAPGSMLWGSLWPKVLDRCVIRHKELGDIVAAWHRQGMVRIDGLPPRGRKPRDDSPITLIEGG